MPAVPPAPTSEPAASGPTSRRQALALGLAVSTGAWPLARAAAPGPRLAAAWRCSLRLSPQGEVLGPAEPTDHVGLLVPDWDAGVLRLAAAVAVPDRVHGLEPDPAGGFLAVAYRPGRWLMRVGPDGQVRVQRRIDDEPHGRSFNGHARFSPDGRWLYTSETDPRDDQGWIGVRRAEDLRLVHQWPSQGVEPHDLRVDDEGRLWVAHGGILRAPGDRKRELERMQSSLVRLGADGRLQGRWQLDDRRLSLRHLVLNRDEAGVLRVGVALQAEHDDAGARRDAPVLAVWQGDRLALPPLPPRAQGYASDIAAGPAGGFYLSGEKVHAAWRWDPRQPDVWSTVARVDRAGALGGWVTAPGGESPHRQGVWIAAARGLARWHPTQAAAMLSWPLPLAPDNHLVLLPG